ncbi:MAG: ribonuclease R [Deltaproteobacteria bacterium]|jgi:ribonuclease R|nr:ribonuclease R [Deltaproteobacteria bacterium]MCL5880858.1 ribonuclease R [Deltaproteobacteria bacterium]MDA8303758.1 ribonuclease R [Deltaproteobacteria bacterium]
MKTVTKEDIVYLFSQKSDIPLSFTDIKHNLNITSAKTLLSVKNILDLMVNNGELILTKGEKYAYPQKLHLIQGKVLSKRRNYAFVSDDSGGGGDIFVKNSDIGDAIYGDTVILKIIPDNSYYLKKRKREKLKAQGKQGKFESRRGRVIRIIKRELKNFKAVARVEKSIAILTPIAPEFDGSFYFDLHRFKDRDKLKNGAIVNAVLPDTNDFSSRMALVDKILGDIETRGTEEDIIINKYNIYEFFDERAVKELKKIPADFEENPATSGERTDLTALPFITIDGEDAKDFDDAVYLEGSEKGNNYKLYVAIADVSCFVGDGSYLDQEAFKRGNSTYFPKTVYPMLPEMLSNNLCSLLPKKNRFTMVCEMDIDNKGKITGTKIYKGLIKTFGRLTYNETYKYLTMALKPGKARTDEFNKLHDRLFPIKNMLLNMKRLAKILRNKRIKNGGLDFDSLSGKVILNENGEVISVIPEPRNFVHDLIEDFMIAANCAVAQFIESKKVPSIYRVHERPDEEKVKEFLKILKYFKFSFPEKLPGNVKDYQTMLNKLKETPLSSFLEQAFLRSMKIAVYSPVNIHHFGLALKSYTHFTSPIRRYADLMVHRILKWILYNDNGKAAFNNSNNDKEVQGNQENRDAGKMPSWLNQDNLKMISNALSRREKLSTDAEREYSEFKKMQFLKKNSQKVYEGFITNVINFGFFVDITGFFIQGFVHVSTIADDYYEYNDNAKILKGRHSKKIFKMGDRVAVSVYSIDLLKHEIDLRFIKFYEDN